VVVGITFLVEEVFLHLGLQHTFAD
jgi:hypothetical protein